MSMEHDTESNRPEITMGIGDEPLMDQPVWIQMMGGFVVHVGNRTIEEMPTKSRKGISLMEYLVIHHDHTVSNQRLFREFWPGRLGGAPENALKTLVSRTRAMMNEVAPDLGACIVSQAGGYIWKSPEHVKTDVVEIMSIFEEAKKEISFARRRAITARLQELYTGDLFLTGDINEGVSLANWLHREYLDVVYDCIRELSKREEYNEICTVCQNALKIDELDDNLHMELMQAMVNVNRIQDAVQAYQRITRNSRRYLDAEPTEELQELYQQIVEAGEQIRFNLDVIRNELAEQDREPQSPLICDYRTFKEFYNIQMRNLERFGHTMSLGVIMLGDGVESMDPIRLESAMAALTEILRRRLRKGDIATRFSENIYALLLPTVNYNTGSIVMERLEQLFRQHYPDKSVPFYYRVSLLGGTPD